MPPDGTTAFISYSREDSEFVLRMARDLKAAGADVWLDQLDIQPGQRWARALQDAITNSPRFLVILSPASVKSTNVEDEVTFALEERKTIIPVMYCDCNVPFQLRSFQYADFRRDYDHGLRILLQTLGVAAGAIPASAAPVEAKASEEKRKQEGEAKRAAEQARLKSERKAVAEKARLEEERKAAEQARAEKRRKTAAAARLERERQETASREVLDDLASSEEPKSSVVKQILFGALASIALVIGIYMFNRPSKPAEPEPVSHAKPIDLKPPARAGEPPANGGQANGVGVNGASASNSGIANGNANGRINSNPNGIANGAGAVVGGTGRAALLGEHRLSLQWISWEKFGTATVVNNDGVLILKGSQHVGDEYLTVEGSVTSIEPRKFTMHGVIVTKIDSINNGQPCKRSGDMTFAIAGGQKYWRLQEMNNPCAAATDYVDIYLR